MNGNLTRMELRCLELAASRLRDKEIAQHLGVTPKTVSNHLQRAYRKLGVSNRDDAVRRLGRNYPGQETGIAPPLSAGPDPGVTDNDLDRWTAAQTKGSSGAPLYERLGRWRTPPRWGGARIGLIMLGALGLLLVVSMTDAVLSMIDAMR